MGILNFSRNAFLVSALASQLLIGCASTSTRKMSPTEHAGVLVQAADGAIQEKDPSAALQFLAEAEALDNTLPEIYLARGIAYQNKNMLPEAIQSLKKAVLLRPDYSEANNSLGRYLMDNNQLTEAEPYLLKAATDPLYRESYKPLTNLGILAYRQGEFSKAERHLKRAIETNSGFSCISSYYLGHIRMKQGRFSESVKDYENSTKKFCGDYGDAHLALGIALERDKQYERARKKFLDVKQRYPDSDLAARATQHLVSLP